MRILIVHNRYQQPGGEDVVVRQESAMLQAAGHTVEQLVDDNDAIVTPLERWKTAVSCTYSPHSYRRAIQLIENFHPDIVHVHNFFPRLSPAVHYASRAQGIPLVQTLHNFRLLCPGGTFYRAPAPCETCRERLVPWAAVRHRCYRNSASGTLAVAAMNTAHRILGTWQTKVARFIAPTESSRSRFISAGFPASRIAIKPHFTLDDPTFGTGMREFALYVGRLSAEKGITTLLSAWPRISGGRILRIVGDGPLADQAQRAQRDLRGVEWLPALPHAEVLQLMRDAAFLVVPSVCVETFGLTTIEAFSAGLPVIGSRLGAIADIVADGSTGKLFSPGDADELAALMEWAFTHPSELQLMRKFARKEYESRYTPSANLPILLDIYRRAIAEYQR